MGNINLLDCTLRDGGYCNDWKFGENAIAQVIQGLENSKIDIIECGYLKQHVTHEIGSSIYSKLVEFEKLFVNRVMSDCQYVCMVNYGEYDIDKIPQHYESTVDGIRVAFHKKDMKNALQYCNQLVQKGYAVFVQPMVTLDYSCKELCELIEMVNQITVQAVYIVDSFGAMNTENLKSICRIFKSGLKKDIQIGFHGHNNLQMSYANAQEFLRIFEDRNIIIDSCIFGMGRGAGNLSTELFEEYLNANYKKNYLIEPILNIYDQVLERYYVNKPWGYTLPNYLSAKHNCHPNYAQYWDDKNTLSVSDMNTLFGRLEVSKKNSFDKKYAEEVYIAYMKKNTLREGNLKEFINTITHENIMIVASGVTSKKEKDLIIHKIKEKSCVVISINREYPYYLADYVFVSNLRRFESINHNLYYKTITTSNISSMEVYATIEYGRYLNQYEAVEDNALLMLLKFLAELEIGDIYLAGVDGFAHDVNENYADFSMLIKTSNKVFDMRNSGMQKFLNELKTRVSITMVTSMKYIRI